MAVKIFCSYAEKDEKLLEEFKGHLRPLISGGLIEWWHDRNISVGTEWQYAVDSHLNKAEIILLLISQYFMDSDYAYTLEAARALERHEHGEARIIPILLRPIYYGRAPFAKLQALPIDALPVTSWRNQDEAFAKIAKDLQTSLKAKEEWPKEGDTLSDLKRYEEALATYEQAIHLDSNYAQALTRLAQAIQNNDDEAIVRTWAAQLDNYPPAQQYAARVAQAKQVLQALRRWQDALKTGSVQNIVAAYDPILNNCKQFTGDQAAQLLLALQFAAAYRADDDQAIVASWESIESSPFKNALRLNSQEQQRLSVAYKRKEALVKFRQALASKRVQQIVADYDTVLDDNSKITQQERDLLQIARHFVQAYQSNDDQALAEAWERMQEPEYQQAFLFTEQERQHAMLAQQRKAALLRFRLAIMDKRVQPIVAAYNPVLDGSGNVTASERNLLALARQLVQSYQSGDDQAIVAAWTAIQHSPYRNFFLLTDTETRRITPAHTPSPAGNNPQVRGISNPALPAVPPGGSNDGSGRQQAARPYTSSVREKCLEGDELRKQQRYSQALQAYEEALRMDPRNFYAWNGKGTTLYNQGNYKKALEAYQRATEIDPDNPIVWVSAGLVLNRLQRYQQALVHFERALSLDPQYVAAWNGKADAQLDMNMPEEAHASYEEALAYDARSFQAWNGLGNARSSLHDFQGAVEAYTRALLVNSRSAVAWCNKAEALMRLGHNRAALDALTEATEMDRTYARAWTLKADVYEALGNSKEAQKARSRAKPWGLMN